MGQLVLWPKELLGLFSHRVFFLSLLSSNLYVFKIVARLLIGCACCLRQGTSGWFFVLKAELGVPDLSGSEHLSRGVKKAASGDHLFVLCCVHSNVTGLTEMQYPLPAGVIFFPSLKTQRFCPALVVHTFNLSTRRAEAGGSL